LLAGQVVLRLRLYESHICTTRYTKNYKNIRAIQINKAAFFVIISMQPSILELWFNYDEEVNDLKHSNYVGETEEY